MRSAPRSRCPRSCRCFVKGLNPDGISYLSIAQKYLDGDFKDAVNAYWGPLYSWLMMPLLASGLSPTLVADLLGVVLGGLAAFATWRLASALGLRGPLKTAVLAALIPLFVLTAHQAVSPDLLLTCVLLLYLQVMADETNRGRRRAAVAAGALGGLAYWSKAYGFYFFLVHFTAVAVVDLLLARGVPASQGPGLLRDSPSRSSP